MKHYKTEGASSPQAKQRRPKVGEKRDLSNEQEWYIQELIMDKLPDQLKIPYVSRKAAAELMEQETGLKMPIQTVGEYLKR